MASQASGKFGTKAKQRQAYHPYDESLWPFVEARRASIFCLMNPAPKTLSAAKRLWGPHYADFLIMPRRVNSCWNLASDGLADAA